MRFLAHAILALGLAAGLLLIDDAAAAPIHVTYETSFDVATRDGRERIGMSFEFEMDTHSWKSLEGVRVAIDGHESATIGWGYARFSGQKFRLDAFTEWFPLELSEKHRFRTVFGGWGDRLKQECHRWYSCTIAKGNARVVIRPVRPWTGGGGALPEPGAATLFAVGSLLVTWRARQAS